ncbi:SusC/RagA family TonB-linked outer membrane protein [Zobellia alginiliquefaciens]|uniref:SusC/RagA family TonB-linked outer membrane protein n=1 Tax=Zobellia alginiliquefaciens TaxID=3032586 RepID=UPI0023E1CC8A|nr:SusC/RagA family TonB-linked outer membrane protein [Zobellia alginiliquefaciens]
MKQYILTLSCALLCLFCIDDVMAQDGIRNTKQDTLLLPFTKVSENRLVGAIDVITSDELLHSGYPSLSAAIEGQVPGFTLGRVRGRSRGGQNDGPLVVIDGLSNRFLSSLQLEEVDIVYILKDATAKMLYGSRGANGVVVIKTKRGTNSKKRISLLVESGIRSAGNYPEFVDARDYMKYRNQALRNDGKDILFSNEDVALAGTDYRYPDVDYYDMFVNDTKNYKNVNAQLVGGDEKTRYFFNLGYVGEDGIVKVGEKNKNNAVNVRSNLDYKINDVISVNLDISGRFFTENGSHVSDNELFNQLSSTKPTDYPIFISAQANVDSLGTSDIVNGKNLYGELAYSGYQRRTTSIAQTNIGMNFDLSRYIKGLKARAYATFDMNNYISEGKSLTYRTLKPALTAAQQDTLIVNGVYNPKGNEQRLGDSYYRNLGGGAYLDYDRIFGKHALNATLNYLVDNKTVKTVAANMETVQDDKSMNFGLRLNYAFQDKYVAEVTSSYMGSTRFNKDNRWKLFNAFGVSYIVSEEKFMDNLGAINYLKLKASYGKIGYDQSFQYLLYNDYYQYWSGSYATGVKNSESLIGTQYVQAGNPNLTYETSTELNIGITTRMFRNRFRLDAEFFTEKREGMPTTIQYAFPKLAGTPNIVANYNAIDNKGFEVSAKWGDQLGDFGYSIGGNFTHYISQWAQYDELNDFSFQNTVGQDTDAIWGYVADGFYTSAEDIASYGAQNGAPLTSSLGPIIPGDLKFKNLSNSSSEYTYDDNVINNFDRTVIGNSTPRYIYSAILNLQYKKFSFYARGQGVGGFDRMNAWNSYYTNKGNAKYSKFVYDAAVPTFDSSGNAIGLANANYSLPRLTSENSAHSYNSSTFFLENAYYFKLNNIELNYKFPDVVPASIAAQDLNIFIKADDLMTFRSDWSLDAQSPNSGLTSAPRYTTVSLGVKIGF